MKKAYKKPLVVIEDFSLNVSVAGDCELITTITGYGKCPLDYGGDTLFIDETTGCGEDGFQVDDGNFNLICYFTPTDNKNVFTSG